MSLTMTFALGPISTILSLRYKTACNVRRRACRKTCAVWARPPKKPRGRCFWLFTSFLKMVLFRNLIW